MTREVHRYRIFLAAEPPLSAKQELADHLLPLRALADQSNIPARWVPSETYHLTLMFVGAADPSGVQDLITAFTALAEAMTTFEVSLRGGGVFPNHRYPSLLWVGQGEGVEPMTELARRSQDAASRLGYTQPDRPFRPHITVARLPKRRQVDIGDITASLAEFESEAFDLTEVALLESHLGKGPARYERIASFKLAARK